MKWYLEGVGTIVALCALLVVSAHWEEPKPAVHFGAAPGMLYDYSGFPPETYRLSWPAPGSPELAARVEELLRGAGFDTVRETERGYDHGTFVPLMVAFPEAEIPVAQLSLSERLDPAFHVELGRALEPLRDEGVLILTNGMSYHNMGGFFTGDPRARKASEDFDAWLTEAVALGDIEERKTRLAQWTEAPGGLASHPRSEHLVPLFVAAGAGGADPGRRDFSDIMMGVRVSAYAFG